MATKRKIASSRPPPELRIETGHRLKYRGPWGEVILAVELIAPPTTSPNRAADGHTRKFSGADIPLRCALKEHGRPIVANVIRGETRWYTSGRRREELHYGPAPLLRRRIRDFPTLFDTEDSLLIAYHASPSSYPR